MWLLPDILRQTLRLGRSYPSIVVAILASLTLGLALVTAVTSLFDNVFLRPWSLDDPQSLVVVDILRQEAHDVEPRGPFKWAYPDYVDLRDDGSEVGRVAIYQDWPLSIAGQGEPFRGRGMFVSANYFEVLGLQAAQGRLLADRDGAPDAPPVVVLSFAAWRRHFASDRQIVGGTVRVNGQDMTVVGVGPQGFRGTEVPVDVDLWLPVEQYRRVGPYPEWFDVRGVSFFTGIARLAPGVDPSLAQQRWNVWAQGLAAEHPKSAEGMSIELRPLLEGSFTGSERRRHLDYGEALLAGSVLILFVCAVNLAHLLWGLAAARRRELAIRSALGAPRGRLLRQLVIEMLLFSVAAGLLAWPAARGILYALSRLRPPNFPQEAFTSALDVSLFASLWALTTVGACALTCLVFWRATRPRNGAGRAVLSEATVLREGSGHRRGAGLLVALQIALACVALVASLLFVRGLQRAYEVPLGFDSERLLVVSVAPAELGWDETRSRRFYERAAAELADLPQVESVAWSENRLLRGATWQRSIYLDGSDEALASGERVVHRTNVVSSGFFATAGIELRRGEDFSADLSPPSEDAPALAIINQTLAESAWPGDDPIGRRFRFDDGNEGPLLQVVGVAADAKYRHVREAAQFFVYLPLAQHFKPAMTLHVRSRVDPRQLLPTVRQRIQGLAPDMPLTDVNHLDAFVDQDLWLDRVSAMSLTTFAAVSWLLAALGIYGVLSHLVARQQRELGIRRSLGASAWQLSEGLRRTALTTLGLGTALGAVLSFLLLRSATAVDRRWADLLDWPGLLVLAALLLAAVGLGFWLPFRRARGVDPAHLLRQE